MGALLRNIDCANPICVSWEKRELLFGSVSFAPGHSSPITMHNYIQIRHLNSIFVPPVLFFSSDISIAWPPQPLRRNYSNESIWDCKTDSMESLCSLWLLSVMRQRLNLVIRLSPRDDKEERSNVLIKESWGLDMISTQERLL